MLTVDECRRLSAILEEVRGDRYLTPHKLNVTAARLHPILFGDKNNERASNADHGETAPTKA